MRTNTLYILGAALGASMLLASCDNIDEQDRLIPIEREHSDKVVLVEEFTGARCVNCPTGAAKIHDMLEVNGDNMIAVSLYPSQLAELTTPWNVDLRTPEATEYYSAYNGTKIGLPCGMFDRTQYNGAFLLTDVNSWPSAFSAMHSEQAVAVVNMTTDYDSATRTLTANYDVEYTDPVMTEVSFQLWVVENGIVSRQSTLTGIDRAYVNNHVLRGAINGTWGDSLGATHAPGSHSQGSASITLKDNWVAENVQVVGFLYRASDRHVLQAHIVKSITE